MKSLNKQPADDRQARPQAEPGSTQRGKLAIGALGFLALTVGVFWYQFSRFGADASAPGWDQLRWEYLALLLLCLPVESLACAFRTWAMTRILEPRVKLWTCFKAEWANVAVSTLTPTQSGGGPGLIYMLNRGGASVGTALTIMLLSCVGTLVGLLCLALYSLFAVGVDGSWSLLVTVVWAFAGIGAAMAVVAVWPGPFRVGMAAISRVFWRLGGRRRALSEWWPPGDAREGPAVDRMGRLTAKLVDLIYTYRTDVSYFLRAGRATFACVCLLSVVFLLSRATMAYLCLRFLGIEAVEFLHVFEAQIVLILVEFFAPSPGGAGVVEGASLAVMAEMVPSGFAPYYTLLWRATTLYLPALVGFFWLARAMLQDARRVVRPAWSKPSWGRAPS